MARRLAIPLTLLGGAIFVAALIANSNPVYGAALLVFACGLACFLVFPLNPRARSPLLAHGGLALAIAAAVADAAIDFADAVGTGSTITTVLIVAGGAAAAWGRTTKPLGSGRRAAD
jgi:hypothetical protein